MHTNYKIRWQNYRRFQDTGWIEIRPLTILIGANNSGKTSVISPLLLLKQTFEANDWRNPLLTRGPILDVGGYKELVHGGDKSLDLQFGFRYHMHKAESSIRELGAYPPGAIELRFGASSQPQQLELKEYHLFDLYERPYVSRLRKPDGTYSLKANVPGSFTRKERSAIEKTLPTNFFFTTVDLLSRLRGNQKPDKSISTDEYSKAFTYYLGVLSHSYKELRDIFMGLAYVGPLRQPPQRYYRIEGEYAPSVGTQGENAANIIRSEYSNLKKQVDSWVNRFELGEGLIARDVNDDLFELRFKSGRTSVNIADVGFGASQVVPLIVQALAAPRESLTIAEQPEIHLNPRLQCVLADLFVQMAKSGHRVLVETHSEHLLLRLRTLVASGKIRPDDVAIYYVERGTELSTIRDIPLDADGRISRDHWPRGFFDDALRESLTLATAQTKKRVRK